MSKFQSDGYVKVENLVDAQTISTISKYFENRINRKEWLPDPVNSHASRFGKHADPLIEVLLASCQHVIEQHTGLLLEPTYSFSRVYQGEEELTPHTDRPACEISVTVNVACTMAEPWPIWMQYKDRNPVKCMLNPGDAVIYKGCDVTHWRRPLPKGEINPQFMLHYVSKNGPNLGHRFDGRAALGLPPLCEES